MLSIAFLFKCAIGLSFLAIPTGRFIDTYPINISLAVGCQSSPDGNLILKDLDSVDCDFKPTNNLSLTLEECGVICFDSQEEEKTSEYLADWSATNRPHHKFQNGLFFKENWFVDIDCSRGENCSLNKIGNWVKRRNKLKMLNQVSLIHSPINKSFTFDRMAVKCVADYDRPFRLEQPLAFQSNNSFKSDQGVLSITNGEESVRKETIYKICRPQCLVRASRSDICANKEHVIVFDPQLTFWLYLGVRILFGIFLDGCTTLSEGASVAVVINVKGDLGVQRIFGLIGLIIFCPLSGALIDHFSVGLSVPDYRYSTIIIHY